MTKKITDFFALEGNYPDLDAEGAVARLSQAIQCRTINYADHSLTDYSEFDKLHAHMKASYPHIMRAGVFERLGHHAVLITIPGSDKTLRPCLYMSHQDVVPVVEGTEQDWTHPAFSGDIADGYIWGRGTLDIKEQVFGVLEAAGYYGISPEHIYCVGDNDNDLPMLRVAKIGFVPEGSVAAGRDERLQLVRDADHGCVENVIRLLEWRYQN